MFVHFGNYSYLCNRYQYSMRRGEMIKIVNEAKIMGGKFGRSNIFATHSLTHSLTISLKQQRESDDPGEGAARTAFFERSSRKAIVFFIHIARKQ